MSGLTTMAEDALDCVLRRYEGYVAAFNAKDFEALKRYIAPGVVFEWGGLMDDTIGRDAFFDFYRVAWQYFDEHLEARVLRFSEEEIVVWIDNELRVVRDWPDSPFQPYRAGEVHRIAGEVAYHLRDGMIVRIV